MRSIESSSHTARALLPWLLLGSFGAACNARLAISTESAAPDAGVGGTGGSGGTAGTGGDSSAMPDAGATSGSCEDGIRSGNETDIDCGGDSCGACATGASCERHTDCEGGVCRAGLCVAASCEDGIRNGSEAAVDCGGDCQRCRASTCNCAGSPELTALECDETAGYLTRAGVNATSVDGGTFVFTLCRVGSDVTTGSCMTYRRKPDGTREAYPDVNVLGLSSDGQRLLIWDQAGGTGLVGADGVRVPVALSYDARLSGDGATVFGGLATGTDGPTLARWTAADGVATLGDFPELTDVAEWEIGDVSQDGSLVVVSAYAGARYVPFRWTVDGGLQDLGAIPGGADGARPSTISADGSTIAGVTTAGPNVAEIFRWRAADGMVSMGPAVPPSYIPDAGKVFLTADGTRLAAAMLLGGASNVVVNALVANAELAFLTDMTADGSVLVGSTAGTGFLWRPPYPVEGGVASSGYDVTPVGALVGPTTDVSGWHLETISSISDDGRVIYGGATCGGVPTYYRLQLRP